MSQIDESSPTETEMDGKSLPRFGSYIGVVFVIGILGALSLALIRDPGTGHAFAKLEPGMTPTQVAAALGVPQAETKSGSQTVQCWRLPDGTVFEVTFQDGKLVEKKGQGVGVGVPAK